MSLFRSLRRRIDDRREAGFSLLEVVVAMGLFALVTASTLPMVLTATRAGLVAKLDTGAKALAQERFEYMRSLPYHLDNSASTGKDLLDQYYPAQSTKAAPIIAANALTAAQSGWVSEANTSVASTTQAGYRLPSEPPTGAFYRVRHVPSGTDGNYTVFTSSQFLKADKTAYPASTFTSYRSVDAAGNPVTDGTDSPPSALLGVTVTAYWTAGNLTKKFDMFSEISEGAAASALITAQSRAIALQITGTLDSVRKLDLAAGIVNADAALSTVAGATSSATGAHATITPTLDASDSVLGATASYTAEPDDHVAGSSESAEQLLDDDGTVVAAYGRTTHKNVKASVVSTPPSVATACTSTGGDCTSGSVDANDGTKPIYYNNRPSALLELLSGPAQPVAFVPGVSGSAPVVSGRGWITSSPVSAVGHSVTSGAEASLTHASADGDETGEGLTLRLLPTAQATEGLIQITLNSSRLVCTATGASSVAPVPSYSGKLRYWTYDPATGVGAYQTVTLTLTGNDPLQAIDRTAVVVGGTATQPVFLSQYIDEWGSLTSSAAAAAARVANNGNSVSSNIESLISLRTVPLRVLDPGSVVSVKVGALSCLAEDNR